MGLWDALFPNIKNSITEVPDKIGGLTCENCRGEGLELYIIEPCWYFCTECAEAHIRKQRFEDEEKDWNKS
jgi:hypothetical protein